MQTRRWVNPSQPQTLQIAVFFLYFDAVRLVLIGGLGARGVWLLVVLASMAASVAAAYGIANERRPAYYLGVAMSALALAPFLLAIASGSNVLAANPIGLMIAVAQLALLVHPQSRNYQRIWFK